MTTADTWWERLERLYELVGQVHTFAVGPGMARIHQPGQWSVGEIVFGAEHHVWYVRSQSDAPPLGALLRERFPDQADAIEEVAQKTAGHGLRLGRALVDAGVFTERDIVHVLQVQSAHGLLDIVGRLEEGEIDVAWTPLSDGAARLPSPTLDEAYLAAAHRAAVASPHRPAFEELCDLRAAGLAGEVFVRHGPGSPLLPVRRFGPRLSLPDLFRLSHEVTVAAEEGDGARPFAFAEATPCLIVEGDVAAVVGSAKKQGADEVLAAVEAARATHGQ